MAVTINIDSQIVVQTAAQWAADATVYSGQRLLITSDVTYTGTDQRKLKIANGVDTWSNLDYLPIDSASTLAATLAAGNSTNNVAIISPNTYSSFKAFNTLSEILFSNGVMSAGIELNSTYNSMTFDDGVANYGYNTINAIDNTVNHSLKVNLDAPNVNLPQETESRPLWLDANKNIDTPTIAAFRANIGQDKITNVGNTDTNIAATDKVIATNAAFTAPRTWTLPAANSVNAGYEIIICDLFGGVTSTNTLTIARSGSDTINGATSEVIQSAYGMRRLVSDGSSKWTFDAGIVRLSQSQTLTNKTMSGSSNTFSNIPTSAITGYQGYTLQAGLSAASPADATTYYIGRILGATLNTVDGDRSLYIMKNGTVKAIRITVSPGTTAGSNETSTLSFRLNSTTDTTITSSFQTNLNATYGNLALNIPVTTSDFFEIKWVTPTWATNPVAVVFNIYIYIE